MIIADQDSKRMAFLYPSFAAEDDYPFLEKAWEKGNMFNLPNIHRVFDLDSKQNKGGLF